MFRPSKHQSNYFVSAFIVESIFIENWTYHNILDCHISSTQLLKWSKIHKKKKDQKLKLDVCSFSSNGNDAWIGNACGDQYLVSYTYMGLCMRWTRVFGSFPSDTWASCSDLTGLLYHEHWENKRLDSRERDEWTVSSKNENKSNRQQWSVGTSTGS